MRIVCIGGGPAGLYFGLLMKKQDPANDIVVIERNHPYDTFGWGVVFSEETLGNIEAADPESYRRPGSRNRNRRNQAEVSRRSAPSR